VTGSVNALGHDSDGLTYHLVAEKSANYTSKMISHFVFAAKSSLVELRAEDKASTSLFASPSNPSIPPPYKKGLEGTMTIQTFFWVATPSRATMFVYHTPQETHSPVLREVSLPEEELFYSSSQTVHWDLLSCFSLYALGEINYHFSLKDY